MAFAVSSVVAAIGVGVSAAGVGLAAYGLYENSSNQKKASDSQAAAARDQAQIGSLQSQNVDVQKQQLDLQTNQQHLQNETQRNVIAQQSQADALRLQAAELDSTRRRRDAIRQGIVAQSTGLTRATNQGASAPGSTVGEQARADIEGQTDTNIVGISQNLGLGRQLYDINRSITDTYLNASKVNDSFVDKSKSLQSNVLDTQKKIYALGGDASSNYASAAIAGGNAALGAGIQSLGVGLANSYPQINRLTNYFTGNPASGQTNLDKMPNDI